MRPVTKVYLYEGDEKFFGEGPYRLLKGIEETGSLRRAAMDMKLSYSKAINMVAKAESVLGFSLTEKKTGGKGGGGSTLTAKAVEFLSKYEKYREACHEANAGIYTEIFSK